MRIDRLDLEAFGKFTGVALDFDAGKTVHVVYGPNAAGKSTALRAVVDLLFGIPEPTEDAFLHDAPRLRIGARITAVDGRRLAFARRKGRKDTVLAVDGKPLPDSALSPFLGAIDRERFEATFGLDHERLRQGAEALLRTSGALGESLFEAAGGTRSVRKVLEALSREADQLFKPRASNPYLNQAVARHTEARRKAREHSVAAEAFRALEDERNEIARATEENAAALTRLDTERSRLQRIGRNLPRLTQRAKLQAELSELESVPDLPENAREERLELLQRQRQLGRRVAELNDEIRNLEIDIERLDIPDSLLKETEAIQELNQVMGAVRKAADDLPARRNELASHRDAVADLLAQARHGLGADEALALRPSKPQLARIDDLANRNTELHTTRQKAGTDADVARLELETQERALAALAAPHDTGRLADAIRRVQQGGALQRDLAECASALHDLLRQAEADAAALLGWAGPTEALETLAVPSPETVRNYREDFAAADRELAETRARCTQRDEACRKIADELARLRESGPVPSLEDLRGARDQRERGWRLVRRAYVDGREDPRVLADDYDPARPLAEAYEAAVAAADDLADRLRTDAARVAADQDLRRRRREEERLREEAAADLLSTEQRRRGLENAWTELWAATGVRPLMPAEMSIWLESLRRIRDTLASARKEQLRRGRLAQEIDTCRDLLANELVALGQPPPASGDDLATLLARAERSLAAAAREAQERGARESALSQCRKALAATERERSTVETRLAEWRSEWSAAVTPLGFAADASPAEVRTFLALVDQAATREKEARGTEKRIRDIARDAADFGARVTDLARRVAMDCAGSTPEQLLQTIVERHTAAVKGQSTRTAKQEALESARARRESASKEIADVDRDLQAVLSRAGCSTLDGVEGVERRSTRKREARREFDSLEAQLLEDGGGQTADSLVDEAHGHDGDGVQAALSRLASERSLAGERHGDCVRQLWDLDRRQQEIRNNAGTAALAAQEAEEELAAIRSHAERYVRLRLAHVVLRDFVERYRERHQDPVLRRTSQLFPQLTLGSFTAVRADFDANDRPVLVGVLPSGGALHLEAMSDGTRDQLHLALRLAAVEQYVATAEPLPFVADDLLVHFDDERAGAALRVLAEFSARTQVLFFTHHRHLVELARRDVPEHSLQVLELPGDSP